MCSVDKFPVDGDHGVSTEMRLSALESAQDDASKRPFNVKSAAIGSTHATDPRVNMRSHWDATHILDS